MFTQWSPEGLYLATFHPRGLILWGGPNWRKVQRFAHPGAWKLQFSPGRILRLLEGRGSPGKVYHRMGRQVRARAAPLRVQPHRAGRVAVLKWSHDGTMFARKGTGIIQVYKTPECKLLDKKSLRADGVCEFFCLPAATTSKMAA